jgi:hypothetical protein
VRQGDFVEENLPEKDETAVLPEPKISRRRYDISEIAENKIDRKYFIISQADQQNRNCY